jgi:hypothetical protein
MIINTGLSHWFPMILPGMMMPAMTTIPIPITFAILGLLVMARVILPMRLNHGNL